jgi:hypothetical protein
VNQDQPWIDDGRSRKNLLRWSEGRLINARVNDGERKIQIKISKNELLFSTGENKEKRHNMIIITIEKEENK